MLPEAYEYKRARNSMQYEFYSEGPRGRIRKFILYTYIGTSNRRKNYNLGFGDYDPEKDEILDLIVSDNKDQDKILATVAATALHFADAHPGCVILFRGSTPARTRLYQMNIARHYEDIARIYDFQCLTGSGEWVEFKKGANYTGFLFRKKVISLH